MATSSAPPNPYSSMAAMPGPMPPKKDDKAEQAMKAFHGIFKAMSKVEELYPGLGKDFGTAKEAMKNGFANVLKGDPTTLDDTKATPPPPSDDTTTPPAPPATPPDGAQPPM